MPDLLDTPTGENGTEVVNGSQATGEPTTATPTTTTPEPPQENPYEAEAKRLKAELDQARMRENQLKNQQEAAERQRLEEANDWKAIAEQAQAKLDAQEAEREEAQRVAEAKAIREAAINSYENDAVKNAAKAMLEKNDNLFFWNGEVESEEDAKAQVISQLDAIAGVLPQAPVAPEPDVTIDSNNPGNGALTAPTETLAEMEARLAGFSF